MQVYYFTEKGYAKLKQEIDQLEKYLKNDIAQEIATAREQGDLRENAEYEAAKEKQANHMAKLGQLQERFVNARIIRRQDLPKDTVTLGKRVKLLDIATGTHEEFTILGEGETDIDNGIISYQTPIAKGLINHKENDEVEIQLPRGVKKYRIVEIAFFDLDS